MRLLPWLAGEGLQLPRHSSNHQRAQLLHGNPKRPAHSRGYAGSKVDLVPWNSVLVTNAGKGENAAFWGCFRRGSPAQGGREGLSEAGGASYRQEPWLWMGRLQGSRNKFPGCILGILPLGTTAGLCPQSGCLSVHPPTHSHTHCLAGGRCSSIPPAVSAPSHAGQGLHQPPPGPGD